MITQQELHDLFYYSPFLGLFFYRHDGNNQYVKKHAIAGSINQKGYRVIRIKGRLYYAHRLVWMYVYGCWPKDQVDHINLTTYDNRIVNLRECTTAENQQNRLNVKGCYWIPEAKKWRAFIRKNNKLKHLGYFNTHAKAKKAYDDAKFIYHTFCPVPGK